MPASEREELLRLRSEQVLATAAIAENKRLHELVDRLSKQLDESFKANEDLRKLLADLQVKLDALVVQQKKRNRRDYGNKTERYNPSPAISQPREQTTAKRSGSNARTSKIENLPADDINHSVADDQRLCNDCGVQKVRIGEDVTYQLDRVVNTMKRLRHIQEILACPKCKSRVVVAPKPEPPFPKCFASSGLLADGVVSRYADFTPLYRLERIYSRQGAPIPRSTLCDWILSASLTLEPLYHLMLKRVFQSKVIGTDDTEVKIQDRKVDKNIRKGKITPYIGDGNNPYNIFDFSPNKSFQRNRDMLATFKGFVQCDASGGFDAFFKDGSCAEVGCNAHARRKIFECLIVAPEKAREIVQLYREIYAIEAQAKESGIPPDKLLKRRQLESKPLFGQLHAKLLEIQSTELPQSPLVKAGEYILRHWIALTRFLDDPDLAIDNNRTEQAIKDFVLFRKNALFVGSDAGGKAAAICMSLISSAKRNAVEPWSYLKDIFDRINSARTSELAQFLPDVWLKSQATNS